MAGGPPVGPIEEAPQQGGRLRDGRALLPVVKEQDGRPFTRRGQEGDEAEGLVATPGAAAPGRSCPSRRSRPWWGRASPAVRRAGRPRAPARTPGRRARRDGRRPWPAGHPAWRWRMRARRRPSGRGAEGRGGRRSTPRSRRGNRRLRVCRASLRGVSILPACGGPTTAVRPVKRDRFRRYARSACRPKHGRGFVRSALAEPEAMPPRPPRTRAPVPMRERPGKRTGLRIPARAKR